MVTPPAKIVLQLRWKITAIFTTLAVLLLLESCAKQKPIAAVKHELLGPELINRAQEMAIYKDKRHSVKERQTAFDQMLETFTNGTPADVVRDSIEGVTVTSRIIPPEEGERYQISFDAPDGSRRWISIDGEKVKY